MKNVKVRHEASKLPEVSHLKVCYATQPPILGQKLNPSAFDAAVRAKAIDKVKRGIDEAYQLGASSVRVLSGKDPGDEYMKTISKIKPVEN